MRWRLEARGEPSPLWTWASPLLALALTMAVGAGLFAALGKDPLQGLSMFFWMPVRNAYAWGELGVKAAPLLLIALGLAVCFRSNVWNIGAEGQYIAGAMAATWAALHLPATAPLWPLVVVAGVLGGLAWAALVALLRERFHANEILVSLMLVYVAVQALAYVVTGPWKDPMGFNFPQTQTFAPALRVPTLWAGTRLGPGVLLGLAGVVLISLLLFRTRLGFAWQVGGLAPAAARYAGFSSRRALWAVLLLSGGLAGLAGALEVAGPIGQLTFYLPAGYGFAAIIVAFVGRLHPLGMVASALLMSMFYIGGELAQSRLGLPKAITGVFQGMLLFALLACDTLLNYRLRWERT